MPLTTVTRPTEETENADPDRQSGLTTPDRTEEVVPNSPFAPRPPVRVLSKLALTKLQPQKHHSILKQPEQTVRKSPQILTNDRNNSNSHISQRTRSKWPAIQTQAKWQETVKRKRSQLRFLSTVQVFTFECYRDKNRWFWSQTRASAKAIQWWVRTAIRNRADWRPTDEMIKYSRRATIVDQQENFDYSVLQPQYLYENDFLFADMPDTRSKRCRRIPRDHFSSQSSVSEMEQLDETLIGGFNENYERDLRQMVHETGASGSVAAQIVDPQEQETDKEDKQTIRISESERAA